MSPTRLRLRSLWYHRKAHLAVLLGIATATAVMAGALVLGDSLRGSLRQMTFDRLQGVEFLVRSLLFFRESLAEGDWGPDVRSAPAVLVPGTLVHQAAASDRMLRLRERAELDRRTTLGAAEKQDKA